MKFNAARAAFTAAILTGSAYADEEASTASVVAEAASSVAAELPTFTVSTS